MMMMICLNCASLQCLYLICLSYLPSFIAFEATIIGFHNVNSPDEALQS